MIRVSKSALTVWAALIIGAAVPALAQQPETDFSGWLCKLDLTQVPDLPEELQTAEYTFDSIKRCPGNVGRNITIQCRKQIDDWTAGSINVRDAVCIINGAPCGRNGFLETTGRLQINTNGRAQLTCSVRR